jgi:hypothetical protein
MQSSDSDQTGLEQDRNSLNAPGFAVARAVQSTMEPFSCASRRYSDSGRTAWKYRLLAPTEN